MRKLTATAVLVFGALFLFQPGARAQQADVYFAGGTLEAPSASSATGNHAPYSIRGGFYPTIGGDFLLFHHLGAGVEISWRGSRGLYGGDPASPFRPVLYDFNVVFAPPIGPRVQPELQAGIGVEDIRYYTGFFNPFTGTNYVTSKHFLSHFGLGVKLYVFGNFFLRPEADVYVVRNNVDFSADRANGYSVAIGYTFGSH